MTEENRPDPGLLLKKLQYEEKEKEKQTKGKLKIFLGYAAGSGKTYAMLGAAHEAKKHQVDVVAGYIEPHARPDTQAMAEGLEEIPPLMVDVREHVRTHCLTPKPCIFRSRMQETSKV